MSDPCEYIRNTYGVPAFVGGRVITHVHQIPRNTTFTGTIKGADHYLYVLLDGEKKPRRYHPTHCIDYLNPDGSVAASYGDE